LFHRVAVIGVCILLQILLYVLMIRRFSEYRAYFNWFCIAVSVAAVLWIINNRSNPAYKLGWVIIILLSPVIGGLIYLLLGGNRLSRGNQRRLRVMQNKIKKNLEQDCRRAQFLSQVLGADAGHMARYLERSADCPVYGNTATKYYPLGELCFPDMLEALEKAQRFIFLEYFIISRGQFWNAILEVLERKVAQGVQVRVIYDDVGSMFTLPRGFDQYLQTKGIKCRVFNRLVPVLSLRQNNRDHRKYLIVDGAVAFTGGINLADEYINVKKRFGHWKDSAIRLTGDGVWSMTVSFLAMWDFTERASEDFRPFRAYPAPEYEAGAYVQPYTDCPWDEDPVGQTVYLNLINRAKRYVYMTTPYLVLDYAVNMALITAAKAGVDVRIITPHIPDKRLIFELTRAHYEELLEAGVKIYEYTPGFIHAKNVVVDDNYGCVGTVNLDYRSMFLHFEDGVMLYGTRSVLELKQDFMKTQALGQEVTLESCRDVPWYRHLGRTALMVFAPLL
jgi:cardiolipin synthase